MPNPIFQGLTAIEYAYYVNQWDQREGMVNGLWNAIFQIYFPAGNNLAFTFNPEVAVPGGYIDILVNANDFTGIAPTCATQIVYEGKGGGGDTFALAYTQVKGYADQVMGATSMVYLVVARGRNVMIWRYRKGVPLVGNICQQMFIDPVNGLVAYRALDGIDATRVYDIVTNQHQIDLLLITMQLYPGHN